MCPDLEQHSHSHCHHDSHHNDHHDHGHSCKSHKHGWGHLHVHTPASYGIAFTIGILLNSLYIIAEAGYGFLAHSLSLLADAGHNLSDVLGLGGAWLAQYLAKKSPSQNFTYGFKRATILASLSNAILLLLVTGCIIWEAFWHLLHPALIKGAVVSIVAFIGILVNGITALLLMHGAKHDLNMRGAFLHMLSDAVMALTVMIAGIIIYYTHFDIIDPLISLFVSLGIIWGTWALLSQSLELALDGVPKDIPVSEVEDALLAIEHVKKLHHLHIWAMSTTETALTVHLLCDNKEAHISQQIIQKATKILQERFSIIHPTFQIEYDEQCYTHSCAPQREEKHSHTHHHDHHEHHHGCNHS